METKYCFLPLTHYYKILSRLIDRNEVLIGTIQEKYHLEIVLYTKYEKAFAQQKFKIFYYFTVLIKSQIY